MLGSMILLYTDLGESSQIRNRTGIECRARDEKTRPREEGEGEGYDSAKRTSGSR